MTPIGTPFEYTFRKRPPYKVLINEPQRKIGANQQRKYACQTNSKSIPSIRYQISKKCKKSVLKIVKNRRIFVKKSSTGYTAYGTAPTRELLSILRETKLKFNELIKQQRFFLQFIIISCLMPLLPTSSGFELKPSYFSSKQVVLGHDVHLPCELPAVADNPQLILWLKDQNTKPFYSYDERERLTGFHKTHNQSRLENRISFSFNKKIYSNKVIFGHLKIKNITSEDAGNYTCRVDFLKAQTVISVLNLEVFEPIWRLTIFDNHNKEISRETNPIEEAEIVRLRCKSIGGNPPAVVEWVSEGIVLVTSTQHKQVHLSTDFGSPKQLQETEAVLTIPSLEREDLGKLYTCRANNSLLTPMKTRTVKINMYLKPVSIGIESPISPLWAGKEAEFVCKSWGSKPAADIKWSPDIIFKMHNSQISLDQNSTLSRARMIATPEDDGQTINCTASNPNVPHYSVTTSHLLSVYYAPKVDARLASFLDPENIKERGDVYFVCNVKANPKPKTLVWFHNNQVITENRENGILVQGQNLVLQAISRRAMGSYQCQAGNTVATIMSTPVHLSVMYAPECKEPINKTISVGLDEEAILNCNIDSNPSPQQYLWRVNGSNGWKRVDPQSVETKGLLSTFRYIPAQSELEENSIYYQSRSTGSIDVAASNHHSSNIIKEPYATVYCLATNEVGRQKEPCIFNISPAGPPSDLATCSLVNQSATTLGISCIPGHDGGLKSQFHIKVINEDTRKTVVQMKSETPNFVIEKLKPGVDYLVAITAVNKKGKSQPYFLEGFALKVAENKIGNDSISSKSSPLLGIFIGVVTGFIVMAAILIVVARLKCRRKLDKNSKIQSKKLLSSEDASFSPATKLSVNDNLSNDFEINNEDPEGKNSISRPDIITAQISDGRSVMKAAKCSINFTHNLQYEDEHSSLPRSNQSTPPPLLGLSNLQNKPAGVSRTTSSYAFAEIPCGNGTFPRKVGGSSLKQPLHSDNLHSMSLSANKYYTLKMNCTRKTNESFV